jgi:hypothetical protein
MFANIKARGDLGNQNRKNRDRIASSQNRESSVRYRMAGNQQTGTE